MEQGVGGQVIAGGGHGPGPQGGAGDGGVRGQDRGGPQFLDPTDGGRHLRLLLVREADEEVDPDLIRGEPGLPKMGQGGFQFPRLEFGVQAGRSQGGGFHPQAQGGEVGPLEPARHLPGDEAGMEAVGGMEPEGAAAAWPVLPGSPGGGRTLPPAGRRHRRPRRRGPSRSCQ